LLRRQRAIEIVPRGKPLRWRRYDVPQHLAPETSDALRFCAVEGDLDLLDRRHRSTIEAGSFVVSTGPPLARLWRMQPALEDRWDQPLLLRLAGPGLSSLGCVLPRCAMPRCLGPARRAHRASVRVVTVPSAFPCRKFSCLYHSW